MEQPPAVPELTPKMITPDALSEPKPSILGAGMLYLIVVAGLMLVSAVLALISLTPEQGPLVYYGQTIFIEAGLIGIPCLIYFKRAKLRSYDLRFSKLPASQVFTIIGISVFSYPVIVFINFLWMLLIILLGGTPNTGYTPASDSFWLMLTNLLMVGVLPGFFEELLCRGMIMNALDKTGSRVRAVLISAVLFGALHMSLQSLLFTTLMGAALAVVVMRTNSIWAGVTLHITNNSIAVLMGVFLVWLNQQMEGIAQNLGAGVMDPIGDDLATLMNRPEFMMGILLAVLAFLVIAVFCAGAVFGFWMLLRHLTRDVQRIKPQIIRQKTPLIEWLPLMLAGAGILTMLVLDGVRIFGPG